MPKVSEAHLEARRQQIVAAAFACFSRGGFNLTTMQDICREAQLSPGAVYRYFRGKEDIVRAMVQQISERGTALVEGAKGQGSTFLALNSLADSFFSLLDQPDAKSTIRIQIELWAEALHNESVMDLLRRDIYSVCEIVTAFVRAAQDRGEIKPDLDPESVSRVFTSLFDGLLFQRAMDGNFDLWKYVAVVKAMGMGLLCQLGEPGATASPPALPDRPFPPRATRV
ncbi:MAG: TetR/AcrR family transcriptional regulator [Dehalococcoidia bacterium]|nr:TetR/AcrR family transcriptional regulator [Dehalococcoidia bacterium]